MTKKAAVILAALLAAISVSPAQTLTPLVHPPPGGTNFAFQLTDGTVMCQANREQDWWKLTPDNTGSYVNGTWTKLPSLQPGYVPDGFASAVLADGRLVITGGRYNNGQFTLTNLGAIYDPIANKPGRRSMPPRVGTLSAIRPRSSSRMDALSLAANWTCKWPRWIPATLTWTLLGNTGK